MINSKKLVGILILYFFIPCEAYWVKESGYSAADTIGKRSDELLNKTRPYDRIGSGYDNYDDNILKSYSENIDVFADKVLSIEGLKIKIGGSVQDDSPGKTRTVKVRTYKLYLRFDGDGNSLKQVSDRVQNVASGGNIVAYTTLEGLRQSGTGLAGGVVGAIGGAIGAADVVLTGGSPREAKEAFTNVTLGGAAGGQFATSFVEPFIKIPSAAVGVATAVATSPLAAGAAAIQRYRGQKVYMVQVDENGKESLINSIPAEDEEDIIKIVKYIIKQWHDFVVGKKEGFNLRGWNSGTIKQKMIENYVGLLTNDKYKTEISEHIEKLWPDTEKSQEPAADTEKSQEQQIVK